MRTITPNHPTKAGDINLSRSTRCIALTAWLVLVAAAFFAARAEADLPKVVASKDGTPISYEVYGQGEPALVFVHGWSCDARYWREQIPHFVKNHRVVLLDLAGHGHSGTSRAKYTMQAFGEDVRAVTEAAAGGKAILIGHSMGGLAVAEAALLMPDKVIGIIGVDTLEDLEYSTTAEEIAQMIAPLKSDFQTGSRQFIAEMIAAGSNPLIRDWIIADVAAAPPNVALSAMNELLTEYSTGALPKLFDRLHIPVVTVNADLWPINYEANRRHIPGFEAIVLQGTDHFLMLNTPARFNDALAKAISTVLTQAAQK
ncbi:MAG: alpha/beta hydrolase [Desulforhopalus sp.]|nr:alpha/beta hydrolase [Desulforhopalus sp.]